MKWIYHLRKLREPKNRREKLTASANSGIGSGNLYSVARVMSLLGDESGKVATFSFAGGNEKRCLHLVVVPLEKHNERNEGNEETCVDEEEVKKGARQKLVLEAIFLLVLYLFPLLLSSNISRPPLHTMLFYSNFLTFLFVQGIFFF